MIHFYFLPFFLRTWKPGFQTVSEAAEMNTIFCSGWLEGKFKLENITSCNKNYNNRPESWQPPNYKLVYSRYSE